ncbi:hypothetical protein M405DRAFT_843023, partial [Rhizopogon salebrosus TDB-379]
LHGDLHAAKSWTTSAEQLNHPSALAAYQIALKFLADWQHVTGLSSSSNHFDVVSKATSSLAMDAFSCSVRYGDLEAAVVLVEQGRSVFWTQLAHFQTPLDEISASGDMGNALAVEFKEASLHLHAMLEISSEDKTSQIRQLTMQRDDVISRIRMLPDFSRFLLPPLFSDLRHAAEDGPVIIVNSSRYSCDAMIILSVTDPVHVPLHHIAQADILELSKKFQSLTEHDAGSSHNQLYEIVGVLRRLWERVVGPIAEALKHTAQPGSRIWWCPTAQFALLPLHAAGPYAKKSHNFADLYISSYTPTLAALIRARQRIARDASTSPHFVAIGQGNPDKGKVLRRVAAELHPHLIVPEKALVALNLALHGIYLRVLRYLRKVAGRDSQHEVVRKEDNEQDDEHKKDDDEDELWSRAKAGGSLERVLLVATLDVLSPAAIMVKRSIMQYFCDVLDSWLMSRPHPYWMLTISNLKWARSVMDLCLLHQMQRNYLTFRVWTWDAMDRYQSSTTSPCIPTSRASTSTKQLQPKSICSVVIIARDVSELYYGGGKVVVFTVSSLRPHASETMLLTSHQRTSLYIDDATRATGPGRVPTLIAASVIYQLHSLGFESFYEPPQMRLDVIFHQQLLSLAAPLSSPPKASHLSTPTGIDRSSENTLRALVERERSREASQNAHPNMIKRMQFTSSVDTPPGSFSTMSSSSYPLSLGSAPASLIRVIPRSPLTLQSHPRTRAKDRSSKNTPANCEGLRYRTPGSSHLPHPQAALSTALCSRALGTPPVSQLPLVHQRPSCLPQDRSSKNTPTNCPSAPATTSTRNQRQRQLRLTPISPKPIASPTRSPTSPKPIVSLTCTITMQPYYKHHLCFFGFEMGNIAHLALIGAGINNSITAGQCLRGYGYGYGLSSEYPGFIPAEP